VAGADKDVVEDRGERGGADRRATPRPACVFTVSAQHGHSPAGAAATLAGARPRSATNRKLGDEELAPACAWSRLAAGNGDAQPTADRRFSNPSTSVLGPRISLGGRCVVTATGQFALRPPGIAALRWACADSSFVFPASGHVRVGAHRRHRYMLTVRTRASDKTTLALMHVLPPRETPTAVAVASTSRALVVGPGGNVGMVPRGSSTSTDPR
jgi:hypothetical protein